MWWRAHGRPVAKGGLVLVAGAAPAQATPEVVAIGEGYPDATVLTGARANVAGVLAALDGAASAHLATHGEFRADNPLFSHLRLVDGALTVYDLSALRRPPGLLTLSACDSGLSAVHPGDELQGLAAALLGLGTRTVVASLGPVDDEATRQLMVGFYDRLRAGAAPAAALAAAQSSLDPAYATTGGSFVCLGAG
jgi:CHAT domain-containing protein